jgi:hypothetical protein
MALVWSAALLLAPSAEAQTPGPASCSNHDDFERLVEQVQTNCCDQFDQVRALVASRSMHLENF